MNMKLEKDNWIASTDAMSKKEKKDLVLWLEKNAEIKQVDDIKTYTVPILGVDK